MKFCRLFVAPSVELVPVTVKAIRPGIRATCSDTVLHYGAADKTHGHP